MPASPARTPIVGGPCNEFDPDTTYVNVGFGHEWTCVLARIRGPGVNRAIERKVSELNDGGSPIHVLHHRDEFYAIYGRREYFGVKKNY